MKHIARLLEMKPCLSAILIMTGLALGAQAAGESPSLRFPLEGKWKHTTSDSTQYSDSGFDDKDWIEADVARSRGCPIGPTSTDTRWDRTRFVIPDSFKSLAAKTGTLTLNFPDVMGQDFCWVNGREIGKTEEDTGAARFYLIRESDLNFDKANCLAVRVLRDAYGG